ncbi:hypothetical protein AAVH_13311 [Aphelenchoides avenae]|nr:hypothetical protein AAVH_13311 [Aphelenchus avenae]
MLQHVERAEKTAMEKKIIEQEGIIAYQKRELTELAGIRADYERMKQALENAQNELAESKAEIAALKHRLNAKTGPPTRLQQAICVKGPWDFKETIVARDALLPVTVARPVTLKNGRHYKVVAGDTALAEFALDPELSSASEVSVLVAVGIGVSGALTGSVEYDDTKMEFKNAVGVVKSE